MRSLSALRDHESPGHHAQDQGEQCRTSVVRLTVAPAAAGRGRRSLRSHPVAPAPSTSAYPRPTPWALRLQDAAHPPSTRTSRAGTWPRVKLVRPVGRSSLTRGQNPALRGCGSTTTGCAPRSAHNKRLTAKLRRPVQAALPRLRRSSSSARVTVPSSRRTASTSIGPAAASAALRMYVDSG